MRRTIHQPAAGNPAPAPKACSHTRKAAYSYLFQGQEYDDEINGASSTSYAFEYRLHDPRIGRFLSIDPLAAKYPHNSPYAFSENRVLDGVELEGLEFDPINKDVPGHNNGMPFGQNCLNGADKFQVPSRDYNGMDYAGMLVGPKLLEAQLYGTKGWGVSDWIGFAEDVVSLGAGMLLFGPVAEPRPMNSRGLMNGPRYFDTPELRVPQSVDVVPYAPDSPLPQQVVGGVDIPTPDPAAGGAPHTTLGTRIGGDGVPYRQSATFTGGTWPKANGLDVPWSRVDWTDHGRPWDHTNPHQHKFELMNRMLWGEGEVMPFEKSH